MPKKEYTYTYLKTKQDRAGLPGHKNGSSQSFRYWAVLLGLVVFLFQLVHLFVSEFWLGRHDSSGHSTRKRDCINGNAALSNGTWVNNHSWVPHSCDYRPLSHEQVARCLNDQQITRIAFIGDSVMNRVFGKAVEFIHNQQDQEEGQRQGQATKVQCSTIKNINSYGGDPHPLHKYYNIPLPDDYVPPPPVGQCETPSRANAQGEPTNWFGRTECTGCGPMVMQCLSDSNSNNSNSTMTTTKFNVTLDMNAVEFASDVEVTWSPYYNTTQEIIVLSHLEHTQPTVIIGSVGHHDVFLWGHPDRQGCRETTVQRYRDNLERYMQLLTQYRSSRSNSRDKPPVKIVWFSLNLVATQWQPDAWKNKTDNGMIREMNTAAKDILQQYNVPLIDVWDISTNRYTVEHLNDGGVHIDGEQRLYYKVLMDAIFYDLCHDSQSHVV